MTMQKRTTSYSNRQLMLADYKAEKLGLSFQEYIRLLVTQDVEDIAMESELLTEEETAGVREAEDDIKKGKFIVFDPAVHTQADLRKMLNEADV